MTTGVSFTTVDGGTSGTTSVPTTGSPEDYAFGLKTYLQFTFGWKLDDIVLEMYEPCKYVIMFDTAASKFIRGCSVVAATTDVEKETVQTELKQFIRINQIAELDFNEVYSHYTITAIGAHAFQGCTSLVTLMIPDSVCAIGDHAFDRCTSLVTLTIPGSAATTATTIGTCAFDSCVSLTTVTISDGVGETTIGACAFYNCTALTSVTIPGSVTAIGGNAFAGCSSLVTLTIPDSVATIGESAFAHCTSLTTIVIPESVTTMCHVDHGGDSR
jgi:hypothetical protein